MTATRWVCASCWHEERGSFPAECPRCVSEDIRWSVVHAGDPRPMAHIVLEALEPDTPAIN